MKFTGIILAFLLLVTPVLARADFNAAANAYRSGHYSTAYKEFLALAKTGNPRAQTVVALMNKYGESVPQNPIIAFSWYLKAAKQGYGPALYQVGVMYAEGKGVKQNRKAAIKWLIRAQKAGFKRAAKALTQLGTRTAPRGSSRPQTATEPKSWDFRLPNNVRNASTPADRLNPAANYRVELGSMSTRNGAGRLWDALVQQAPDVFKDAEPLIVLAKHSQERLYRVQTGPFNGRAAALEFCQRLQRQVQTICQPVSE